MNQAKRLWWLLFIVVVGCSSKTIQPTGQTAGDSATDSGLLSTAETSKSGSENSQSQIVAKEFEALGIQLRSNAKTRQIESADFSKVEIDDQLAAKCAQIDSLIQLVLRQSSMTDEGWKSLSALKGLQHLDLRECPINSVQLRLVAAPLKLRSLRLSGKAGNCDVDDSGLDFLPSQAELKLLALDGVKVGDAGIKHLVHCPKLAELYLAETLISDSGLDYFKNLRELKKLRLAQTSVTGSGLQQLDGLPIEELDVSQCANVDDVSLSAIGKLTSLKRLNLWSSPIEDAGLAHLGGLSRLQWLNLDNTKITDSGLQGLTSLSELSFLHLGSTAVSDNGLLPLVALKNLKQLIVTRTQVTKAGVESLQKLMPSVDIQLEYVAGR